MRDDVGGLRTRPDRTGLRSPWFIVVVAVGATFVALVVGTDGPHRKHQKHLMAPRPDHER